MSNKIIHKAIRVIGIPHFSYHPDIPAVDFACLGDTEDFPKDGYSTEWKHVTCKECLDYKEKYGND